MQTVTLRMPVNGMHAPQLGAGMWDIEQMYRVARGSVVMIDADTTVLDMENDYHYRKCRAIEGPFFDIYLRYYPEAGWDDRNRSEHWCNLTPEAHAEEFVRRVELHNPDMGYDPHVIMVCCNEPDLISEGHLLAATMNHPSIEVSVYDEIWNWQESFYRRVFQLRPNWLMGIGIGHLAGGHDPYYETPIHTPLPPDYEFSLQSFKRLKAWARMQTRLLADGRIARRVVLCLHAYMSKDGSGWSVDTGGYWAGLRPYRPVGWREAQGDPPVSGLLDLGGAAVQHPDLWAAYTETNYWRCFMLDENETRAGANKLEAMMSFLALRGLNAFNPFLWHGGPDHWENNIWPNALLRSMMEAWPTYRAEKVFNFSDIGTLEDVPTGGGSVDKREAQLRDMWARQGVNALHADDGFWKFALAAAKAGRLIIPQPTKDGNWQNHDDATYAVAYTIPPMWADKATWTVREGFMPEG